MTTGHIIPDTVGKALADAAPISAAVNKACGMNLIMRSA